jgi:pilus assembly protein CpaE
VTVAATAPEQTNTGRIVTVFSPKGGVGRTTVACNLALALKLHLRRPSLKVALVDCSLPFGDVGVFLNLQPNRTLVDLLPHVAGLDADLLGEFLMRHAPSGVDVLLAPVRPEMAELVTADGLKRILAKLRETYDYVVVDTAPSFADTNLAVLDLSDQIVVPLLLDLSSIKNVRLFLEVAQSLGYAREKFQVILNRAASNTGISPKDVEERLGQSIALKIGSDEAQATLALNQGTPFVLQQKNGSLAKSVVELARLVDRTLAGAAKATPEGDAKPKEGDARKRGFSLPWRAKASAQTT